MSNPLPTDLISMAADGRLKSSQTYLELVEDKVELESDIASMEAQLLLSDRSEEWRNSCLYNLSCARSELKSVKKGILQIEELCRIVCSTLSNKDREERRMKHELAMAEASVKKTQAKHDHEHRMMQSRLSDPAHMVARTEKTKRHLQTLNRDHRAAQLFKKMVKPILGEAQYNLICIEAKRVLDEENLQSTEHQTNRTNI